MSVAIVGAGVSGLYTASLIKDYDIEVFELKRDVGLIEKCSGLISTETMLRLKVPHELIDGIYKRILIVLGKKVIEFESNDPLAVRVLRSKYEKYLMKRVLDLGHRLLFKTRVLKVDKAGYVKFYVNGYIKERKYDYIVIANGWSSQFVKNLGLAPIKETLYGVQVFAQQARRIAEDTITTLHGFLDDGWGWVIPTSNGVLVGVACRYTPLAILEAFINKLRKMNIVSSIKSRPFGGVIVRGYPKSLVINNIAAIGDSVSMVKSFTGGGLYSISIAGKELSRALSNGNLIEYEHKLTNLKRFLKSQYIATKLLLSSRKMLLKELIHVLGNKKAKITAHDYDNHLKALLKLIFS